MFLKQERGAVLTGKCMGNHIAKPSSDQMILKAEGYDM